MEKELLTTVGDVKVYVGQLKITWMFPSMILEKDGKEVTVTSNAGEFELDLGEFLILVGRLNPQELSMLNDVLEVIADSVRDYEDGSWIVFELKQQYMPELENIVDRHR